jgi:trk system potassium uptake protein TrkH
VLQLLFEAASALCSVGLTVGISSELSIFGKWLMLVLMFMGRTGILILSFAVASRLFAKQAEVVA